MKNFGMREAVILVLVVGALAGAIFLRGGTDSGIQDNSGPKSEASLPRFLDLGADKCVPCKMMVPVLEELEQGLSGQLQVEFIDVWKNPSEAAPYKVKLIPTQIFFDASGKELFRHEGFFAREEILGKWREFGYEFNLPLQKES